MVGFIMCASERRRDDTYFWNATIADSWNTNTHQLHECHSPKNRWPVNSPKDDIFVCHRPVSILSKSKRK